MKHKIIKELFKKNKETHFLERLVSIDFDNIYTGRLRFFCHLAMWSGLSVLIWLNIFFGYHYSAAASLAYTVRSLVCNSIVFYLFFYVFAPRIIFKGRIILSILCIIFCVCLWILIDNLFMKIISYSELLGSLPSKQESIKKIADTSINDLFSVQNIASNIIIVFYSISPFFFIKVVFDLTRVFSKFAKTQKHKDQLQIDNITIEKDFLKAQLNPHFLFNTLNNLYGLVIRNDEHAPVAIMQISQMMRYTLYESDAESVPLGKELNFLENYISLEKMRYKKGRPITLNVEGDYNGLFIAPLLTFTFIENAFKYGLQDKNHGFIKINIFVKDKVFNFTIENDISKENISSLKFGGIGLRNVRKRLELIYPEKYELTTVENESSFYVSLSIILA